MRGLLIALAVIGLWFAGGRAEAGTNCVTIKDSDERAYCRAIQTGQKSYCTAIMQNHDLRQTCFVRLGSPRTYCTTVKPGWPRMQCWEASHK
jgi:hypothetical protein